MKKLNYIIVTNNITAYGFPAIKGLADRSNPNGASVIVSTLSAAVMADMGINTYYAPVIPRGSQFATTDDVVTADLPAYLVHVDIVEDIPTDAPVVIVSQHPGTVELLKGMYPNHTVLASVTPENITNKNVVGALPPHLIQYANRFRAVAIRDYDRNKEFHLSGDELAQRMMITSTIRVTVSEV